MGSLNVNFQPPDLQAAVPPGSTVAEAAAAAGLELHMPCGGEGRCGKCRVVCLDGQCSSPTQAELDTLSPEELASGVRLACQARLSKDATVHVPFSSRLRGKQILEESVAQAITLEPNVRRAALQVEAPDLASQNDDLHRVAEALGQTDPLPELTLEVARGLPETVRAAGGAVTATLVGGRLVELEPGASSRGAYGLALDIGTTTVVGYLLDLATGERVATSSALNAQNRFGADVVSRVEFSNSDPHGRERLRQIVLEVVNGLLDETVAAAGLTPREVYEVTVVGNACMHHMLLGLDTRHIAAAPYVAVMRRPASFSPEEVGLRINPAGLVHFLPLVAGWVGADTVGVMLATRLADCERPTMAIDLGTNGEIVLSTGDRLVACSTAAGPAFEGAQIKHGMRAAEGAIEHVEAAGEDVVCHTIGTRAAVGICGSGLLDAVAVLLDLGVLDPSGRLLDDAAARRLPPSLAGRLRGEGPQREFLLAGPDEASLPGGVVLTQADIRQVQLAKGAVQAGVQVLLGETGLTPEQLDAILLAGAFGSYVRPASAQRVGLIPDLPLERVRSVGNAAGAGAILALLSVRERQRAEDIARQAEHLELSARADFQAHFMETMLFP